MQVEDSATQAANEAQDTARAERTESFGNAVRWVVLVGLLAGAITGVVVALKPKPKPAFSPLDTLVYEAMTMEDDPDGRLDLPTQNIAEISDYFTNHPSLGFKAPPLKALATGWNAHGATVIDYDVAKIAVVEFGRGDANGEKSYLFLYKGELAQLPKAELGSFEGLSYQTYSSKNQNVIAWQVREGVVGMVIGHRGSQDLAALAKSVVGS